MGSSAMSREHAAKTAKEVKTYRDLITWRCAMDCAEEVLRLTDENGLSRKFWLVDQIQRAVASIAANIAEGHDGQFSKRMYLKHLFIARGSLAETLTFLELAVRRKYINKEVGRTLWKQLQKSGRLINGLIRSLAAKKAA